MAGRLQFFAAVLATAGSGCIEAHDCGLVGCGPTAVASVPISPDIDVTGYTIEACLNPQLPAGGDHCSSGVLPAVGTIMLAGAVPYVEAERVPATATTLERIDVRYRRVDRPVDGDRYRVRVEHHDLGIEVIAEQTWSAVYFEREINGPGCGACMIAHLGQ